MWDVAPYSPQRGPPSMFNPRAAAPGPVQSAQSLPAVTPTQLFSFSIL